MNFSRFSYLNMLLLTLLLIIHTLVGEVIAYLPIEVLLLIKYIPVANKQLTFEVTKPLLKCLNLFIGCAIGERMMVMYDMLLLSYFTSLYLIFFASYLVLYIDKKSTNNVSAESIVSIITTCILLLFLYYFPIEVKSHLLIIWLLVAMVIYFTLTNRIAREPYISSSQTFIIEQSQWSLFIYTLLRVISNLFNVDIKLSLIFYLSALILLLLMIFSDIKKLKTFFTLASCSAIALIGGLGVEYCYYALY